MRSENEKKRSLRLRFFVTKGWYDPLKPIPEAYIAMPESFGNNNLPEIFQNCDERVFAFGRDKLPHKDKPINAVKYSDMFDAISAACRLGSKNQSQSIPLFLHWMLSKCRKWQISTELYIWPYECRFDSNESIGRALYMTEKGFRKVFDAVKKQSLITRNGMPKDPNRTYCFGPELINIAKMTHKERLHHIDAKLNHAPQSDMLHALQSDMLHAPQSDMLHALQSGIELNKEGIKKFNQLSKQLPNGYPQAECHITVKQSDELINNDAVTESNNHPADPSSHSDRVNNDMVKNDMDLEKMDIHKRDIITAWRKEFFQTTNGKACYRYFGSNFFDLFYSDLSDYLRDQGHNKRVSLIEKLGLEIFGHIVFGEADNPYKLSFESHQNAGHSCAVNYLKTNNFKTLKKAAYEAIDKPEPHEVIPPSPKLETPSERGIHAILKRMKEVKMSQHQANSLAFDFDKNFSKQIKQLKIANEHANLILADILKDEDSWNFIVTLWRNEAHRDSLWKDSSMHSLINKTKTFKGLPKPRMDENGPARILEENRKYHANRPKGLRVC